MESEDSTSFYAVIMAGGRGTRFWPLSRGKKPKHLISITDDKTVIRKTVERTLPLVPPENILIVTAASHARELKIQVPEIPEENIIVEPMGRNTAPCIGLAALHVRKRDPDGVMIVLPSDHLIADEEDFLNALNAAAIKAGRGKHLITIGIKASGPETGYGYIEVGEERDSIDGCSLKEVLSFREKPDIETASEFIKRGTFHWNSGTFVWSAETILSTMALHLPGLFSGLEEIDGFIGTSKEKETTNKVYRELEPVSIDYGVMEKAEGVLCITGDFGWSDIGSWDSLFDLYSSSESCVFLGSEGIAVDSTECLVHSPEKMVALVGVKDIIVVETKDTLLICRRGQSQDVKKVVERLEAKGKKEYL